MAALEIPVTLTEKELKFLKIMITERMQKEDEDNRAMENELKRRNAFVNARPKQVVVGGIYSQFIPGGLYVYEDGIKIGKFPGVPPGYLWCCTSGKPIPNEKVADMVNKWLSHNML